LLARSPTLAQSPPSTPIRLKQSDASPRPSRSPLQTTTHHPPAEASIPSIPLVTRRRRAANPEGNKNPPSPRQCTPPSNGLGPRCLPSYLIVHASHVVLSPRRLHVLAIEPWTWVRCAILVVGYSDYSRLSIANQHHYSPSPSSAPYQGRGKIVRHIQLIPADYQAPGRVPRLKFISSNMQQPWLFSARLQHPSLSQNSLTLHP
jgi:hypothetical protein